MSMSRAEREEGVQAGLQSGDERGFPGRRGPWTARLWVHYPSPGGTV